MPGPLASRVDVERRLDERAHGVDDEREVLLDLRAGVLVAALVAGCRRDADDDRLDPFARELLHRLVDPPLGAAVRRRVVEEVLAVEHVDDGEARAAAVRGREVGEEVAVGGAAQHPDVADDGLAVERLPGHSGKLAGRVHLFVWTRSRRSARRHVPGSRTRSGSRPLPRRPAGRRSPPASTS